MEAPERCPFCLKNPGRYFGKGMERTMACETCMEPVLDPYLKQWFPRHFMDWMEREGKQMDVDRAARRGEEDRKRAEALRAIADVSGRIMQKLPETGLADRPERLRVAVKSIEQQQVEERRVWERRWQTDRRAVAADQGDEDKWWEGQP